MSDLSERVESALEHADDETAVFHLRHAQPVVFDMHTLAEKRSAVSPDTGSERGV